MTGGSRELQILRYWSDASAPTGENTQYDCEDGSTWHDAGPFELRTETGLRTGQRVGDRILPD